MMPRSCARKWQRRKRKLCLRWRTVSGSKSKPQRHQALHQWGVCRCHLRRHQEARQALDELRTDENRALVPFAELAAASDRVETAPLRGLPRWEGVWLGAVEIEHHGSFARHPLVGEHDGLEAAVQARLLPRHQRIPADEVVSLGLERNGDG